MSCRDRPQRRAAARGRHSGCAAPPPPGGRQAGRADRANRNRPLRSSSLSIAWWRGLSVADGSRLSRRPSSDSWALVPLCAGDLHRRELAGPRPRRLRSASSDEPIRNRSIEDARATYCAGVTAAPRRGPRADCGVGLRRRGDGRSSRAQPPRGCKPARQRAIVVVRRGMAVPRVAGTRLSTSARRGHLFARRPSPSRRPPRASAPAGGVWTQAPFQPKLMTGWNSKPALVDRERRPAGVVEHVNSVRPGGP